MTKVDLGNGTPPASQSGTPMPLPSGTLQRPVATGQLVCPVLVGREPELGLLRAALVDGVSRRGSVVIVSGDAGVGKSALVREAATIAASLDYRLLAGAVLEWEGGLPYAPLLSALRSSFDIEALRQVIARLGPDVAPLLPELGQASIALTSPLERHRTVRALTNVMCGLSEQAPLLLVLEDLHWVDEASIALLQHLAREIQRTAIVVLLTYRSDEVGRQHPLSALVAELVRGRLASSIPLRPLTSAQIDELVAATLRGTPVDRETLDAIFARSEGNPLFAEELLKSLSDSGWRRGQQAHTSLPETLRELVLSRFRRLPSAAVATLSAASVIGVHFAYETLRQVCGLEEADLASSLRAAVDEQLVVETREGDVPSFAFRHAITREVIYVDLLLPERRRLHLLVADALSADPNAPAAMVAEHWSAGGDRQRAATASEVAGNAALALNAPTQAVAHFEAAIGALDQPTVALYLGLARAYIGTDHPKAKNAAQHAIALLKEGDGLATRVDLMHIAGRAGWLMGDAAGNLDLANSAAQLVREESDSPAKAEAFEWYASALVTRGDVVTGRDWAERALAVARASGARAIAASALITIASCEFEHSPRGALALIDEAAAIARGARAAEVLVRAHANGIAYSFAVEPERRRFVRIERATEFGQRYGYGGSQFAFFSAFHEFASGHWPQDGKFRVPGDLRSDLYVAWARLLEVFIDCARTGPTPARVAELRQLVSRAVQQDEPQWAVPWLSSAALVQVWAGAPHEFREAVDKMLFFADRTPSSARSLTLLSRGFASAAVVLFLDGQRERLATMREALADLDGHPGERELLDAFLAALDGVPIEVAVLAAAASLGERGLNFATALAVWALWRARSDCALPPDVVAAATRTFREADAAWLAAQLPEVRVAEAAASPAPDRTLHGGWLLGARSGWAAIAILAIVTFIHAIPDWFESAGPRTADSPGGVYATSNAALLVGSALLLAALGWAASALVVLWQRSRDAYALFASLQTLLVGMLLAGPWSTVPLSDPWALPTRVVHALAAVFTLLQFFVLPNGRFVPRAAIPVWATFAAWLALSIPFTEFDPFIHRQEWLGAFDAFYVVGLGAGIYRYVRVASPVERQQLKWLAYATLLLILTYVASTGWEYVIVPNLGPDSAGLTVASDVGRALASIVAALAVGFAILRYRVVDVDLVIKRTVVYAVVAAILAGFFAAVGTAVQTLLIGLTGQRSVLATAIIALVVAAGFSPIRSRVRRLVDRLLPDRELLTVFFVDIVGSTERIVALGDERWTQLLAAYRRTVRQELHAFGGREIDTAGDGFFATFEAPARALQCAVATRTAVKRIGLSARMGLHTGECEMRGEKVTGLTVHIAARLMSLANQDEILVSRTLRNLVEGLGVHLDERGQQILKGVPGVWQLFSVRPDTT